MDKLLTVKEVAEALACSEAAIRKWLVQRRLPCIKIGKLTRLRQEDVERVAAGGLRPRPGRAH